MGSQPQLFDLVARMLRGVARARRTLLVVEDIHWIDETSRDLLHFLARSLRDERLMMVLTARTGDPDYESCRTLVADLTGLRHGTRVELPRLNADQVAAQVADLRRAGASGTQTDTDVARVVTITEGVPLLVEEVVDAGLEDVGDLADSLVGHRLARLSLIGPHGGRVGGGSCPGADRTPARAGGPAAARVSSTRRSVKRCSAVSLSGGATRSSSGTRSCARQHSASCCRTPRGPITGAGARSWGILHGALRPRWLPLTIAVGPVTSAARWRRTTRRRCCRADSRHTRRRSSCSSRPPTSGPSCPTRRPAPARRSPTSSPALRGPRTRE